MLKTKIRYSGLTIILTIINSRDLELLLIRLQLIRRISIRITRIELLIIMIRKKILIILLTISLIIRLRISLIILRNMITISIIKISNLLISLILKPNIKSVKSFSHLSQNYTSICVKTISKRLIKFSEKIPGIIILRVSRIRLF